MGNSSPIPRPRVPRRPSTPPTHRKERTMPQVNFQAPPEALWQAVRTADIGCCTETVLVLTGARELTTHAAELRDSHTSAKNIAAAVTRLARRRIRRLR